MTDDIAGIREMLGGHPEDGLYDLVKLAIKSRDALLTTQNAELTVLRAESRRVWEIVAMGGEITVENFNAWRRSSHV